MSGEKKGYTPLKSIHSAPQPGAQKQPQGSKADRALQGLAQLQGALGQQFQGMNRRFSQNESILAALLTMQLKQIEDPIILRERDVLETPGRYDYMMGDAWFDTHESILVRVQPFMTEFTLDEVEGKEGVFLAVNELENLSFQISAKDKREAYMKLHEKSMEIMQEWREAFEAKQAEEAENQEEIVQDMAEPLEEKEK